MSVAELISNHLNELLAILGVFVSTIWAIVWGLVKWTGKRLMVEHDELSKRLDELERDYVSREEHNNTISALRKEIAEGNRGTHDRLDKMQNSLMLILASGKGNYHNHENT